VVERALAGLPGIQHAEVSFEQAKAWVTYDPASVTIERMVEAIAAAGFKARRLPGS